MMLPAHASRLSWPGPRPPVWLLVLIAAALSGVTGAAEPASLDPGKVKALVASLGSEDWATRESAQRELCAMGPAVRDLLPDPDKVADQEVATRIRLVRTEVFECLIPKEIRDKFPLWSQAFEEGETQLETYQLVEALAGKKCWPALRALVRCGVGGDAWYHAAFHCVGHDPRWTAAQCACQFRTWLRDNPEPSEKDLDAWWHPTLVSFVAERDRQLGSDLAAEMMSSKSDPVVAMGCRLASHVGDRRLAGRLLEIARRWRKCTTDAAVSALAQLRRPAPLPGVSDDDLVKLVAEMLRRRPWDGWEWVQRSLTSALPGKARASLWPLYIDVFRDAGRNDGWTLMAYEQYDNSESYPAWNAPEDLAVLREYLKDDCPSVRGVAAYLLGRWDDMTSRPRLAEMLGATEPPEVLRLVANGISWHKTPYFIPFLRPLLERKEPEVLGAAAAALGVCGDEDCIPRCIELLETGEYRAVEGAAIALKQFPEKLRGNRRIREALKKRLADAGTRWDEDDYQQCAWALAELGTKEDLPAFKEYKEKRNSCAAYDEVERRLNPPSEGARPEGRSEDFQVNVDRARTADKDALQWLREYVVRESSQSGFHLSTPCLVALHFNFKEEVVPVARAMLSADEHFIGDLPAYAAGHLGVADLAPDIAAALERSDLAAGARVWALGRLKDRRAVAVLVERGLDPSWVVSLPDESRAFGEAPHYWGWHYIRSRLLADLTVEALELLTGHKINAATAEERVVLWRRWYEEHKTEFAVMPRPQWQANDPRQAGPGQDPGK